MSTLDDSSELHRKLMRRWIWKIPLIIALVWFAVWWQEKRDAERAVSDAPVKVSAQNAAPFAGQWRGEIVYPSGAKHNEEFFFQLDGGKIYGMASYLGRKRAIEDAQIVGDALKFRLPYEDAVADAVQSSLSRYEARRRGEEIHLQIIEGQSDVPVKAHLMKVNPPVGQP